MYMRKICAYLLVVMTLAALISGCNASVNKSYTFKVETGDSIEIKLNIAGGYDITSELPFEVSCDDEVFTQGTFIKGEAYEQYASAVENDENARVLDSGKKDGNEYIFWSYNDKEFNYAIMIADSETGVILGNNVSEESAREIFERLTISVDD